jgi:hypothetical protein
MPYARVGGLIVGLCLTASSALAVRVSIPDYVWADHVGDTVLVPFLVTGHVGRGIVAVDMAIAFSSDTVSGTRRFLYGNAAPQDSGWYVLTNAFPCSVLVAMASDGPLVEGDTLLIVKMVANVVRPGPRFARFLRCRMNEGQVPCTTGYYNSSWVEREPMPGPSSHLPVKDGAWLAYDSGSGLVFAAKGNKSSDFCSYNNATNGWDSLRAIPLGFEAKPPRQGTCGTSDGSGHIYMAKGNNTLGFWRYTIATDSWLQLADVPAGGSSRRAKAGSGAVYVQIGDSGFVYLLKGPTCEFYRFNVATGTWETLPSAPAGSYAKWYDGSFLVFDGDQTIYAHKARYHELWAYDVATATWSSTELSGMPFVGRDAASRKSGGGGCGAWSEGGIYALKGGSTSEFWHYDATADTWTQFDDLPPLGSTGRIRKVSIGGCIVSGDGALFALKGNQTSEFWGYPVPSLRALHVPRKGVIAVQTTRGDRQFAVNPDPLAFDSAVPRNILPNTGLATLSVFDGVGRMVRTLKDGELPAGRHPFVWDGRDANGRQLPNGIYFIRMQTAEQQFHRRITLVHH